MPSSRWRHLLVLALAVAACSPVTEISAPLIVLDDIEVRSFSGGVADLSIELTLINQNDFEITLVELSGSLVLDEREVGPVHWSGEFDCAKRDTTAVRIPVHLAVSGESELFRSLIDRRQMPASVRGEATIVRGVIRRTYPVTLVRRPGDEGR